MTHVLDSERTEALTGAASAAIEAITGSEWPTLLAEALREIEATWQESAEVCADIAWQARTAENSALVVLTPEHVTVASPDPVIWRTYRHLDLDATAATLPGTAPPAPARPTPPQCRAAAAPVPSGAHLAR